MIPPGRTETAFAKINLALHIRRRRPDGDHDIETIFAFATDGDRLEVRPGDGVTIKIGGPFAGSLIGEPVAGNLIVRAACAFLAVFAPDAGAAFRLDKRLPVASGIGGGSADAAAALRLLCDVHGVAIGDERVAAIARSLGADVPACMTSETMRGEGRGDAFSAVDAALLSGMPLLLVNPGLPLSTGSVFAGWDGIDRGALDTGDPLAAALGGRNDLETPAVALMPEIAEVSRLLGEQAGVRLARMSGSGATCFALFDTAAARDAASATIGASRPDWWRLATGLR